MLKFHAAAYDVHGIWFRQPYFLRKDDRVLEGKASSFNGRVHEVEVWLERGPHYVMAALFSGDPERVKEALDFQRESFKAKFGLYPEECEWEEVENLEDKDSLHP